MLSPRGRAYSRTSALTPAAAVSSRWPSRRAQGLDPATVPINRTGRRPTTTPVNPDAMSLSKPRDHIENFHHGYLREELPRLDFLTRKVAAVHGEHEPRLVEVRRVFESFQSEMASHTKDEDQAVFPAIRRLEKKTETSLRLAANLKSSFDNLDPSTRMLGLRWRGSRN